MTTSHAEETSLPCDGEVSVEEGRRLLDESARLNLHMSADEFLAAWDEGRIADTDNLQVQQVASLIRFAR
jgi:hypothetical protein